MESMDNCFTYILVMAVVSWTISQLIKTFINLAKTKKFDFERLFGAGGWPSAHSSMVCTAAVTVGKTAGFSSNLFAVTCIFSLITMYDAMGVRRAAGMHAKEINKINRTLLSFEDVKKAMNTKNPIETMAQTASDNYAVMKEYLGHSPFEVVSGAILGIIFGLIVPVF